MRAVLKPFNCYLNVGKLRRFVAQCEDVADEMYVDVLSLVTDCVDKDGHPVAVSNDYLDFDDLMPGCLEKRRLVSEGRKNKETK